VSRYWEDYKVGDKLTTPGRTVTDGMINIMAGLAGFKLPLFWDEEEAKKSIFGTRIAPGRITVLLMGGLEEQSQLWDDETMIALLGIDKVRITNPLKAGDTLRVEVEIIEKRETKNPERGIIIHRSICENQRDETVAQTEATHLLKRRVEKQA
jgi:acyl dehydratase